MNNAKNNFFTPKKRISLLMIASFLGVISFSANSQIVGWDGGSWNPGNNDPLNFKLLPPTPLNSEFISYTFPGGTTMVYDQSYLVMITLRNTGSSTWYPGEVSIVQDDRDINWRPSNPTINMYVPYNELTTISFYVKPKPCFVFGLPCFETKFRWQLMKNGVRFGAITSTLDMDLRKFENPPLTPPNPSYGGMILTPPNGPAPNSNPDTSFPPNL